MTNKSLTIGLIVIAIIAIGGYFFPQVKGAFGTAATDIQNTTLSGLSIPQLFIGNGSTAGSIGQTVSTGSCNAGAYAASTTLFGVVNPFNATSTATLQVITGTGQATTSAVLVGTSTAAVGVASTIMGVLANFSAATSSPFWTSGGVTLGSAGYLTAGSASARTIAVGPTDAVVAFATSTATGAGANSYTPGITCTYKIEWKN